MNKRLFLYIVHRLSTEVDYFKPSQDAAGRSGLSPLQKCTAALRQLAYGSGADAIDEYVRLAETTARKCLIEFTAGIINLFGDEYLGRPTKRTFTDYSKKEKNVDFRDDWEHRLYALGVEELSYCLERDVCTRNRKTNHCVGGGCFLRSLDMALLFEAPCTMNDLNILDRSPVFDDIINGVAPEVNYYVNGREYHLAYYLTDGTYPNWATFMKSIRLPQGEKNCCFAKRQEAVEKMLSVRLESSKQDERDADTVEEFQDEEFTFGVKKTTKHGNRIARRKELRDPKIHEYLKRDLIENIWKKFGHVQ